MALFPRNNLFIDTLKNFPGEFASNVGKVQEAGRNFLIGSAQAIPRVGGQLVQQGRQIAGEQNPLFVPRGKLQQTVLGKEPIQSVTETGISLARDVGFSEQTAQKFGPQAGIGLAAADLFIGKPGKKVIVPTFKGLRNLSTKLLEQFRGMPEKIKLGQFEEIVNKAKKAGIRQSDEQLLRSSLVIEKGSVNLAKTAAKVEEGLVPLSATPVKSPRYADSAGTSQFIGDGKYGEIVYESPVKNSAGDVHFPKRFNVGQERLTGEAVEEFPNYFSHVRFVDDVDGTTRRILETQSDLFQKGRFEDEIGEAAALANQPSERLRIAPRDFSRLQPYNSNNPLAQLRTFRQEVKRAATDGKTTLLNPTGETAMKIEGLGDTTGFIVVGDTPRRLTPEIMRVGMEVEQAGVGIAGIGDTHIITDVLADGKFKAVPKDVFIEEAGITKITKADIDWARSNIPDRIESFDISGKVDTTNFVYKLNETAIPKEARRMGLEVEKVGDWWQIKIPKERAKAPIEAFGVAPLGFFGQEEQ